MVCVTRKLGSVQSAFEGFPTPKEKTDAEDDDWDKTDGEASEPAQSEEDRGDVGE